MQRGFSLQDLFFFQGYGARFVLLRDKRPIRKGWQQHNPTPQQVKDHLDGGPSFEVGIIPATVDCAVLDFDKGDKLEGLSNVIDRVEKPPMCVLETGNGVHVWYRKTKPPIGNRKWKYSGCSGDIRADNGYVKIWDFPGLADALEKFEPMPDDFVTLADFEKLSDQEELPGFEVGNRNNELNKRVFEDAKKGNREAIARHKQDALDAGLPLDEVERTVASAQTAAARDNGTIFERKDSVALEGAFEKLRVDARWNMRGLRHEFRGKGGGAWDWQRMDSLHNAAMRDLIARQFQYATSKGVSDLRFGREAWLDALNALCNKRRVDPFIDWVEKLPKWDGKERLDRLLTVAFRVPDDQLNCWASRYPIIGAIQRGYAPGAKIDEFPILIGPQGLGKSAFLRQLLPPQAWEWFSDSCDISATPKERAESLQGRVLVEFAEMTGYTRAQIEDIKAFLSRQDDGSIRLAYRTDPELMLRRCVFVGTSNEVECLPNDYTGLRRFVPVMLQKGQSIEELITPQLRSQLWAEGLHLFQEGERANLPRFLYDEQRERAELSRRRDDAVEDALYNLSVNEGSILDIAISAGLADEGETLLQSSLSKRIGYALRQSGWDKRRERDTNGQQVYIWRKDNV